MSIDNTVPDQGLPHEDRIEEIAERYLEDLHDGVYPDREAIIAAFPQMGESLRRRLRFVEMLFGAGEYEKHSSARILRTDSETLPDSITSEEQPVIDPANPERLPQRVGPFRILEVLGKGGMGVVYLADQTEPIRRRVALKLIKLGMDTEDVIARFATERQVLALMDHPYIARVFEAGATDSGRPYFAMEHAPGIAITEYCDEKYLDTPARLKLFQRVCEGVQHAHQKGMIHRDLKPSNILVTLPNGEPVPKIIDFGIAKATDRRRWETTEYTEHGRVMGTLEYMSPEQADVATEDIDTRTDIYSLGVILYELLAGAHPYDTEDMRARGTVEMRRRIREADPIKPSTRISTLGLDSDAVARRRRTDPASLSRFLRGDLDWITMKAMEKDRDRRYETVAELKSDVDRHLRDDPVLAGPPGAAYRVRKFVRRHRRLVGTAVGFVTLLVVSAFGFAWLFLQAQEARDKEVLARQAEADQRLVAEKNEQLAREWRAELIEMLRSVEPGQDGREIRVAEILEREALRLEDDPPKSEEVVAALRNTIGWVYEGLGLYPEAKDQLEKALELREEVLGEESADTKQTMRRLALVLKHLNELERSETLYRRVFSLYFLLDGGTAKSTIYARNSLANFLLVRSLLDRERLAEARELAEESWRATRDLEPENLARQSSLSTLARMHKSEGDYGEAERLLLELIDVRKRTHGALHPDTLGAQNNLGSVYYSQERFPEAAAVFSEVLEAARDLLGPEHPHTLRALSNLANAQRGSGNLDEAEESLRFVLGIQRAELEEDHRDVLTTMVNLGRVLQAQGDSEDAESLLRNSVLGWRRSGVETSRGMATALLHLATVVRDDGRLEEAAPLYQEALAKASEVFPPWSERIDISRAHYGRCLALMKKFEDAEAQLLPSYEKLQERLWETSASTRQSLQFLIDLYEAWGKPEKAARYQP
ncbi:MAG: serine/threonine-protein kinase [Planctomycetota bacterium]|nr:serine/threonine-protein kinase [Planctomycetota bacterium]